MKTPKDDIFQLVQSMTAAEKRYFKIHFSSEKSLVTKLFNHLNTLKVYNEDEVKNHFKKTKLSKNLKVYKIMLMDLLLKSLASFRYKKDIKNNIRQNIGEIEILIEKNLLSLAYKKIKKTKKLCIKHEEWNMLISILNIEYRFKIFHQYIIQKEDESLLSEISSLAKIIAADHNIKMKNHELGVLTYTNYSPNAKEKKILEDEKHLLKTLQHFKTKPFSFHGFFHTHSALSHLYHIDKNIKKELYHKKVILDYFNSNQHLIDNNLTEYCATLFYYAYSCIRANQHKEFDKIIKKIKSLIKSNPVLKSKSVVVSGLYMSYHFHNKNYDFILDKLETPYLKTIEKPNNKEIINITHSYIHLMIANLFSGNHTKVQFYLRRLFEEKKLGETFNYFFEAIDLISHYESGDLDIFQNLLLAKKRKLKRDPNYATPFFKWMITFFFDLIKDEDKMISAIENFKGESKKFANDKFFNLMKYFILDDWLEALRNKKPLNHHTR